MTIKSEVKLKFDKKYYTFLDKLREGGSTNMFGAAPFLEEAFGFDGKQAKRILVDWMETFDLRHPQA